MFKEEESSGKQVSHIMIVALAAMILMALTIVIFYPSIMEPTTNGLTFMVVVFGTLFGWFFGLLVILWLYNKFVRPI